MKKMHFLQKVAIVAGRLRLRPPSTFFFLGGGGRPLCCPPYNRRPWQITLPDPVWQVALRSSKFKF